MRTLIHLTTASRSALGVVTIVLAITAGMTMRPGAEAASPEPKTVIGPSRHIVLPGRTDNLPFSDAVLVGNTLYLAGKIGVDPQTGRAPEDVEKEIRLLLDGIKATLNAADLTMDDLVSVQIFCPDLSLYEKFNEVYRTYFTKSFPARAFIGSGPLLRGGRFEAQGIAVRR
ncbi:MAG TPA: Rid family hydrolase [Chthoniobacterales bacterium]|jgi:reactive intermediate/imine deaminase|nr:Rid family hydrolase [Chthoniobacterales bacterium]